jgi:hypothetical protein
MPVGIDLYWLPLGAGGHSVRLNGRVFEAVVAALERRPRCDLYHSALEVRVADGRYTIESAPVPDAHGAPPGRSSRPRAAARRAGEPARGCGRRTGSYPPRSSRSDAVA